MSPSESNSTLVRGKILRGLRKRAYKSAEAFSAACGSVSVPTIYRAERGGPILRSYLNRMARELDVPPEHLAVSDAEADAGVEKADLTGDWIGMFWATDRFGNPSLTKEDTQLTQNGTRIEGRTVERVSGDVMTNVFENCSFEGNVLCGQSRSERWTFPFECAVFILSGTRNLSWLNGYLSWFDVDQGLPQFSRYILIRRHTSDFEAELANATQIMEDERHLMRMRGFLEAGYDFSTSLSLAQTSVTQSEATPTELDRKASKPDGKGAGQDPFPSSLPQEPVIAFASLTVLGDEGSQVFLADGLMDDVATDLARTPGFRVLPRSAFLKDELVSSDVAAQRGASHILSGSMRRSDDRLRVNLQLLETSTGQIVWAERYDHSTSAVFSTHDAVARDIVETLREELSTPPIASFGDTTNPRAYELFLKGRSLYLRGLYTHSLRAAAALLIRAIELDPEFARAHAQLSICRAFMAQGIGLSDEERDVSTGFHHAQTALALSPELPLAHAALGLTHYTVGNFDAAEECLRTAIERDPSLFEPWFFLARNFRLQGDRGEAVKHFRMASNLRPNDFRSSGLLAEELAALGRSEEAEAQFRATLDLLQEELEAHPDNAGALAFGAAVLAHLDMEDRAQEWADWAITIGADDCLVNYNVARMNGVLGYVEPALDHLTRAFSVPTSLQSRLARWMQYEKDLTLLSGNPEFEKLLEQRHAVAR